MFDRIITIIIYFLGAISAAISAILFIIYALISPNQEIQPVYVYEDFDGNIGQTNYCYQNRCNIGDKYTSVKWTYKVNIKYNE